MTTKMTITTITTIDYDGKIVDKHIADEKEASQYYLDRYAELGTKLKHTKAIRTTTTTVVQPHLEHYI